MQLCFASCFGIRLKYFKYKNVSTSHSCFPSLELYLKHYVVIHFLITILTNIYHFNFLSSLTYCCLFYQSECLRNYSRFFFFAYKLTVEAKQHICALSIIFNLFFLCSVICGMFRLCLAIINELIHIQVWNFLLGLHLYLYMHKRLVIV